MYQRESSAAIREGKQDTGQMRGTMSLREERGSCANSSAAATRVSRRHQSPGQGEYRRREWDRTHLGDDCNRGGGRTADGHDGSKHALDQAQPPTSADSTATAAATLVARTQLAAAALWAASTLRRGQCQSAQRRRILQRVPRTQRMPRPCSSRRRRQRPCPRRCCSRCVAAPMARRPKHRQL